MSGGSVAMPPTSWQFTCLKAVGIAVNGLSYVPGAALVSSASGIWCSGHKLPSGKFQAEISSLRGQKCQSSDPRGQI